MGSIDWLTGSPSKGFDDLYVEALERNPKVARVERRGSDTLAVHDNEGGVTVISLANQRLEHEQRPEDGQAPWIANLAASFGAIAAFPETFEAAQGSLLPVIRTEDYASNSSLHARASGVFPDEKASPRTNLSSPLCEGLMGCVAFDQPNSLMLVPGGTAEDWGVSPDEIFRVARANLERLSDLPPEEVKPGLYVSPYSDSYDTSRVLLTDWVRLAQVQGEHLVALPNRDLLLIAGTDDLEVLLDITEDNFSTGARPISCRVFRVEKGGLFPYEVPPDHPSRGALQRAHLADYSTMYGDQKNLLEAALEAEETDIFVASFSVCESEDSDLFSMGVWSQGVDTLLPQTDVVAIAPGALDGTEDQPPDIVRVSWQDLLEVAGKHLVPYEDLVPVRYRVQSFPTDEEYAELRRRGL